jgi:hypothetical protein
MPRSESRFDDARISKSNWSVLLSIVWSGDISKQKNRAALVTVTVMAISAAIVVLVIW